MTYKRLGYLAGGCFLGLLSVAGMTDNGRIDLLTGAALMLGLLAIGVASARAGMLLCAYEHRKRR